MARLTRLCIPGWPHLVLQRGHNRQPVFVDDADRQRFRALLQECSVRHGLRVHAYALLDHEVRLLVTPVQADSLSKTMQALGRHYVSGFNRRHGRSGALWEGRFRATVVEPERHLLPSMLYAEGLPNGLALVQEGLLLWSSAAHHLGLRPEPFVSEPREFWSLGNTPFDREAAYRRIAEHGLTSKELASIEQAVASGWPLGADGFRLKLEALTERRLGPLPRGRPKKST